MALKPLVQFTSRPWGETGESGLGTLWATGLVHLATIRVLNTDWVRELNVELRIQFPHPASQFTNPASIQAGWVFIDVTA